MLDDRLIFAIASSVAAGLAEGELALERARGSLAAIGAMLAQAAPEDTQLQDMLAGRIPADSPMTKAPGAP